MGWSAKDRGSQHGLAHEFPTPVNDGGGSSSQPSIRIEWPLSVATQVSPPAARTAVVDRNQAVSGLLENAA